MTEPTNPQSLSTLVSVLNSALEHVPPATREILNQLATPHLRRLEAQLTEKPKKD